MRTDSVLPCADTFRNQKTDPLLLCKLFLHAQAIIVYAHRKDNKAVRYNTVASGELEYGKKT